MNEQEEQLKALSEMRDLMNRSSRFLSLSGLSGICAGVFALVGAAAAWNYLFSTEIMEYRTIEFMDLRSFYIFFFSDAGAVLVLSLLTGWFFSSRKAKKAGVPFWDATAWRMLANLFIPLATGGLFCFALLWYGDIGLIAPATLIFYGLALLNASKYTVNDIRYLGMSEIALGLISTMFIAHGLIFWAIGFGVLHIVYGIVLYYKYERGK
ncbi:MAG TPA: hypothetical protein VFJ43_17630 [Bacteroidia bacterium]|nr:hypothetical protein [Bacteroidia bacterium]